MDELLPVAGNGLLGRRALLKSSLLGGTALLTASASAKEREPWMRAPGVPMDDNGDPSPHVDIRRVGIGSQPGVPMAEKSSVRQPSS